MVKICNYQGISRIVETEILAVMAPTCHRPRMAGKDPLPLWQHHCYILSGNRKHCKVPPAAVCQPKLEILANRVFPMKFRPLLCDHIWSEDGTVKFCSSTVAFHLSFDSLNAETHQTWLMQIIQGYFQ
jgi:hypothetical protein